MRGQSPDQGRHGVGAEQHGLRKATGVQQAVGEDVPALRISGQLDLVDRQELHLAVQRHGLDSADEILRPGRGDLLLAGDQGDGAGASGLDDAIVDLAREQPQRQTDHAGLVAQHPLHRQVGLASVGRAQDSLQLRRRAAGGAVAHAPKVGDSGRGNKRGGPKGPVVASDFVGEVNGERALSEQARNKPCPNQ